MNIKQNLCLLFVLAFFTATVYGQKNKLTDELNRRASEIESKVIAWRQDIHQNPELGNREVRTAALIAAHLRALGIEVKTGVGVTGVVGILKGAKPGPVIALRADMDALPVEERNNLPFASKVRAQYNGAETAVMHACGHDAHVAILMGVAEVLASMKNELAGTVKFIFQPAEEGTPKGEEGGAKLMVKEGVLENPKVAVVFGLHMDSMIETGTITYRPAGIMAGVGDFKITVKGKASHGSQPWLAVDPIPVAAQIVTALQTIVSRNVNLTENAAVVTVGAIHGGNRHNIISEQVELIGNVRAFTEADEQLIYSRIRQIAEKTAEAAGATALVELPFSVKYPVTFNNISLTERMLPSLKKAAGAEKVKLIPAKTGSEDFSFFAEKVPGLFFFLGGMPKGQDPKTAGPHHTPEFTLDDSSFKLGVVAFCQLVFDYGKLQKM